MGIRYICDVCRKEYDAKADSGPAGYHMPGRLPLDKWATISCVAPKQKQAEHPVGFYAVGGIPEDFLVCSQACAEKALDEIKEHLRSAFEIL